MAGFADRPTLARTVSDIRGQVSPRHHEHCTARVALVLVMFCSLSAIADPEGDAYLAGYAAAFEPAQKLTPYELERDRQPRQA